MSQEAKYIGDGVYVQLETGLIKLWTIREEGEHRIYLDAETWTNLVKWIDGLGRKHTVKVGP